MVNYMHVAVLQDFFDSLSASFRCEWWTSKISRQQHEHVFSIRIPNGKEGSERDWLRFK